MDENLNNASMMDKAKSKSNILVVDDIPENIRILVNSLMPDYDISVAISGQEALEITGVGDLPDLILLDVMMPGMDGYEVCKRLKENESTRNIPVIFITARTETEDEARGLELDAVDYITKPFCPKIVKARVKTHLELKKHRDHLDELVRERTQELNKSSEKLKRVLEQTVKALRSSVEIKDPYTSGHQRRVKQLACAIAKRMGFSSERIDGVRIAGQLHDIGKLSVPSEILSKPGVLTSPEFALLKEHSRIGYEILKNIEFSNPVAQMVLQHHEKVNGSGYPHGLIDKDILPESKILCVADVVEAMSMHRPYRAAIGIDKALEEISKNKGILYDTNAADTCIELFKKNEFKFMP